MTYSEEAVRGIIADNLRLTADNIKLQEQLSKETLQRESAEKKYFNLCERCIKFQISTQGVTNDHITLKVSAPRFMSKEAFDTGLHQTLINYISAHRDKQMFSE